MRAMRVGLCARTGSLDAAPVQFRGLHIQPWRLATVCSSRIWFSMSTSNTADQPVPSSINLAVEKSAQRRPFVPPQRSWPDTYAKVLFRPKLANGQPIDRSAPYDPAASHPLWPLRTAWPASSKQTFP